MDGEQFDKLTRVLATGVRRRTVLGALGVGLLGAVERGREAAAQTCRGQGRLCNKDANCCSGRCDPATRQCVCPPDQVACRGACVPRCAAGEVLDAATCACVCAHPTPNRCPATGACLSTCSAGEIFDPATCTCDCSPAAPNRCPGNNACLVPCTDGKVFDPATCACRCAETTCCLCSPSNRCLSVSTEEACRSFCESGCGTMGGNCESGIFGGGTGQTWSCDAAAGACIKTCDENP